MSSHYRLTVLGNGLRVVTEAMPALRSVAVGCWVDTGSRDEDRPGEAGASHFLEHLLFKGTDDVSASDIARVFDGMGAVYNAYTSKDHTLYWVGLVDDDLPEGFRILAEVLQRPSLRQGDIDRERQVVFGEMGMRDDNPGLVAGELFMSVLYRGHPLGSPVIGTRESVGRMGRETLRGYWRRRYRPRSVVVAAAGNISHAEVVSLARVGFGRWEDRGEAGRRFSRNEVSERVCVRERDTENVHLILGGEGLGQGNEQRWAMMVLDAALGGGMSSRLVGDIRERRGLVYAISSHCQLFAETGDWSVSFSARPGNVPEIVSLVNRELDRLMDRGITDGELRRARGAARGRLALSSESAMSRMSSLGTDELYGVGHLSTGGVLGRVLAVTRSDVTAAARRLFSGPRVAAAVGPVQADTLAGFLRQ